MNIDCSPSGQRRSHTVSDVAGPTAGRPCRSRPYSGPRHVVSRPPLTGDAGGRTGRMCSGAERGHRCDFPLAGHTELSGNRIAIEGAELVSIETYRQRLQSHMSDSLTQVILGELGKLPFGVLDE